MLEQLIHHFETLHPAFFILGLALLPLGPVPVSPMWLLAGMRFGPGVGIAISAFCLVVNFGLAYLLSARVLREPLERILLRFKFNIPKVPAEDAAKFTFMIRLVPGNPLCVQNYLLGIMRVRPLLYFGIGLPIQLLYAIAFIQFGGAIFEGQTGRLILAALFLIVIVLGVKLGAKCYLNSKEGRRMAAIKTEIE